MAARCFPCVRRHGQRIAACYDILPGDRFNLGRVASDQHDFALPCISQCGGATNAGAAACYESDAILKADGIR